MSNPGTYWVEASDLCGNSYADTIQVTRFTATINIGPDLTMCNNDTLQLSAPPGYLGYVWSNNYNISSLTSQNVVISPGRDTAYFIKAEKVPGCFAYDTVRVRVNTSPSLHLGGDKSFCAGDSVVFNAGNAFQHYLWSSGSTSAQIVAKNAGTYSVIGTTAEGCKSFDTVKVVTVFANPVVRLDDNNTLCSGTSRILDAGDFASYTWNNGSSLRQLTINKVGTYAVEVKDNNGCKGRDTTIITTILPLPTGILPPDTSLCSYSTLPLQPGNSYSAYLWSTGATSAFITIATPGLYWLQVRDGNNCVGKDSITVNPKECIKGFYIPTGFTPNGDGKNDVFRPMLFGRIKKYEFAIYNRWGQIVFQTTDIAKAWDGRIAKLEQQTNVFAWTCNYQFEGEEVKVEKGTVMLIR